MIWRYRAPCSALLLLAVSAFPVSAATTFGLVDTGELFASTDSGISWELRSTLPIRDAIGLIGGASSELYLASRAGSVYRSNDNGLSWMATGTVTASDVVAVLLGVRPNVSVLALTESGTLWQSPDASVFSALSTVTATDNVSLARSTTGHLFTLTRTGTVRASSDGGGSWATVGTLPVSDAVEIVALSSGLFALTATGDVWYSTDSGLNWTAVGTLSHVHMAGMIEGKVNMLAAATREGEIAISSDGVDWTWIGSINQLNVVALATDAVPTGVASLDRDVSGLSLDGPWPNPTRGPEGAAFRFTISESQLVTFSLYDVLGRLVARRAPQFYEGNRPYQIRWNPERVAPGPHYVQLRTAQGEAVSVHWVRIR